MSKPNVRLEPLAVRIDQADNSHREFHRCSLPVPPTDRTRTQERYREHHSGAALPDALFHSAV